MNEEIDVDVRRKNIFKRTDGIQSKVLVWVVGTLLAGLTIHTLVLAYTRATPLPAFTFGALAVSVTFAAAAWGLRAATPAGAACGGMVCLQLIFWKGLVGDSVLRTGLTPLILLFVLTFFATRVGKQRKIMHGLTERQGGRTAAQVIANLAVAGLAPEAIGNLTLSSMQQNVHQVDVPLSFAGTVILAVLVEATMDTVSSEIGQAFGGRPVMLTSMRRVDPGMDGAVTLVGTLAGVVAGGLVMLMGQWSLRLDIEAGFVALIAGITGLFFDSLLGATVERQGWLGNDLVNFSSTLAAGAVALSLKIFLR